MIGGEIQGILLLAFAIGALRHPVESPCLWLEAKMPAKTVLAGI
jgi:hypothetical protein